MIRINALGGFSVRDSEGNPLPGAAAQPRRMAILALLARAGQRGITREKVLALLWPDADDERGPRTLAQALYALRKDLGAEDTIAGAKELRLDPSLVSSDVAEFASAVSRGDDESAATLFHGPFLDGFHLSGADEFARWVERERATLNQEYSRALESLARTARTRGDATAAVAWWRKLAALEPLNARVTVGLMEALAAAGDRAGAIQHARVYELLVEQELDLPPDREVLSLAERFRQRTDAGSAAPATAVALPIPVGVRRPDVSEEAPIQSTLVRSTAVSSRPPDSSRATAQVRTLLALGLVVAIGSTAYFIARQRTASKASEASTGREPAVVAIGHIMSFGGDSAQSSMAAPLADLLTTSLARVRGIRVVSHGRMLELMRSTGNLNDTSAGRFINAARLAGATEVIDGTLYARPGGQLRLDLRRVDLANGAIGDVHTIEGRDIFALVDSGTTRLVAALGSEAPSGSVADVTTRSLAAYRIYEQGIHAYYRGDSRAALSFFDAALAEDSLFALAAYYDALSDPAPRSNALRMERAKRLAARATDRERLTILAGWAQVVSSPALRQLAETLATRYPNEVEGHLYSGITRVYDGEFLAALEPLAKVLAMDSLGLRGSRATCAACDALRWRVSAYEHADSLPAAEREARRWLHLQPTSLPARYALVEALEWQNRDRESDSIFRATPPSELAYGAMAGFETMHLIRFGDYPAADRLLLEQIRQPVAQLQSNALWNLTISLREQGRLTEALDAARRWRFPAARILDPPSRVPLVNPLEAQLQLETGHPATAATLFDSLAREHNENTPSQLARAHVWMLTQAAGAHAAAGDTAAVRRLVDSVRVIGAESMYGRDRRLYHHVRGLLLAARHDDLGAIGEFNAAIYSPNAGYTRTNYELARAYLRSQRPNDAVKILQPALRGSLESSQLYVSRTELHELLARAWDAAGGRDSAAAHYAWVANAWKAADPALSPRAQGARSRLAALKR